MKSSHKLKRRKDGRLQRKVTMINNITGEKIIKIAYGYTTQELDADADRLRSQYENVIHTGYTLYDYLTLYIADRKAALDGVDGMNTVELYEQYFDSYIKDTAVGNTLLTDLNVLALRQFFVDFKPKRTQFTGKKTKQGLYTALKTALKQATMDALIESNPLDRIQKPDYKPKSKAVITDDQFTALLALQQKHSPQIANLFILDLYSGMRRSEIVALKWTDIDFTKGVATVNKALKKTKEFGVAQGDTKNFTSKRRLLLDIHSLAALKNQMALVKARYAKKGKPFSLDAWVFESQPGRHYALDWVTKSFAVCRDELGYPKNMTLHSFRHTAATNLAEHDIGTRKLMARFGWSTGKMADRYTHETEKMQEDIVEILNAPKKVAEK